MMEELRVALIQTTIDQTAAWTNSLHMQKLEEERAVREIQQHMSALMHERLPPQVVLLPELSVPIGFLPRLKKMAMTMNALVIAGMDFEIEPAGSKMVVNRAVVIIPNGWSRLSRSTQTTVRFVGKTYPAVREEAFLKKLKLEFRQLPEVWVFDAGDYGRFAVAICYDFLDLERVTMYRLKIQHLFVIAYNRDIGSFDHAAEAVARMVFCNVVVCNAGYFGGSAAMSPFYDPAKRLIYRHSGNDLSTSQTIRLPVRDLVLAQQGKLKTKKLFKGLPPGAKNLQQLIVSEAKV